MRKSFAVLIALAVLVALILLVWFVRTRDEHRSLPQPHTEPSTARAVATLSASLDPAARSAEEARVAQAAPHPESNPAECALTVRGRVFDETRRPVAGASVDVRLDPALARTATSAADGTFRVVFAPEARADATHARVWAVAADSRAAARVVELPIVSEKQTRVRGAPPADPNDVDIGTLTLVPAARARVSITAGGVAAKGALVDVACGAEVELVAQLTADANGLVELPLLPAGVVRLDAEYDHHFGATEFWSPAGSDVRLELVPERTLELLVVDEESGAPLASARVTVERMVDLPPDPGSEVVFARYERTSPRALATLSASADAEGRVALRLPARGPVRLGVRADGHRSAQIGQTWIERLESPHRLPLHALVTRSVRWPIVAGEVPVPPDGTQLALRFTYGPAEFTDDRPPLRVAYVSESHVVVEGVSGGVDSLIAETPGGEIARLEAKQKDTELGPPVAFVRARTLDVRVLDAAGAPVAGAAVRALGDAASRLAHWTRTDGEGRATIRGLCAQPVEVRACAPGEEGNGSASAAADLTHGDARVDVVLAAPATVRVQCRIDGVARLPARYTIDPPNRVVEEHAESGELRVLVNAPQPGVKVELVLRATDFLPQLQTVVLAAGASDPLVVFELQRACRIVADVHTRPGVRASVAADRWNASAERWDVADGRALQRANADAGKFVIDGLSPGAYRVRDLDSGFASEGVELDAEHREGRVTLDLAEFAWVEGRIEAPAGAALERARLVVEGMQTHSESTPWSRFAGQEPSGRKLEPNGAFRVAVPADREVTLRAWHPWLVPAPESGAVTVRGGRDGIVLELEARGEVRIPVTNWASASARIENLRVAVFRAGVGTRPERAFHAPIVDGVARFGGLAPGSWTLWIECSNAAFAPRTFTGVEIGDARTELAPLTFERGSSVVVRLTLNPGDKGDGLRCVVTGLDVPLYERSAFPRPDGSRVARGLAAGRHRLRIERSAALVPAIERELELDGVHDVTVDVDLR